MEIPTQLIVTMVTSRFPALFKNVFDRSINATTDARYR